eukprot:505803_1
MDHSMRALMENSIKIIIISRIIRCLFVEQETFPLRLWQFKIQTFKAIAVLIELSRMSSDLKPIQIVYCIFLGIWWFIVCPFAFYQCYNIWRSRNASFFIKRHPRLTIAVVLSTIYWVGIGRPMGDVANIFPSIHKHIPIPISNSPLSQLCIALQCVRIWFLYYNYNHGLQTLSKQWEPTSTANTYWTLSKQWRYFGDRSPVLYYIVISYVIIVDIVLLWAALQSAYLEYILYTSLLILTVIPVLIIAYKVRHFRDELFIHAEFKWGALIASLAIASYIVTTIIFGEHVAMQKLVRHVLLTVELAVWIHLCTKWVLDKYRMQLIEHNLYVQQQNDTQATVKLSNIVKNEETFELFALYLVKEFSIENLIFLYESTRFKEKCVADGFVKEGEMGKVVQFPNKIKSMQANEKVNYEYIVKRFIDEDAPDCINIAFATRKTMIGLMQNDATIVEYINSIDKAMEEIVCLLAFDSCARFMTTQSFHNLYK